MLAAESKDVALRHARANAKMTEERIAADLKKRKHDIEKKRKAFREFAADGEKLVLRAPESGLFLHGESGRGTEYKKDGTLRNEAVFARIMRAGALEVAGEIKEADVLRVKPGLAGEVKPTAAKKQTLTGSLKVGYLPTKSGGFEATIALVDVPAGIRPGMTAAVEIVLEEVRDAVLVPKASVHTKDGKSFVTVWKDNDRAEREVVTGATDGKRFEIREGLKAGESVVLPPAKK